MATGTPYIPFRFQVTDQNGAPLRYKYGEVPELQFHVPPTNFEIAAKKIPTRELTKGGWVEFHGGDDLDILTASGGIGIIFLPGYGLVSLSDGIGTDNSRNRTQSLQFLESLLNVFRNNGNAYDRRGFIYSTGFVTLTYDRHIFRGLFENISYSETVDKPYDIEYNFSFIILETTVSLVRPIGSSYTNFSSRRG